MKSMYLCGMLFLSCFTISAQEKLVDTLKLDHSKSKMELSNSKYLVTFGLDVIKNGGNLYMPNQNLEFKTPFFIEAERLFNPKLSLAVSVSTNQLSIESETKLYVGIDAVVRYNFDYSLFNNKNIETYSGIGFGHYFYNSVGKTTLDLSVGGRYWFSNQFGASVQGLAKVSLQPKDDIIKHHLQFFFGLVWRSNAAKKVIK